MTSYLYEQARRETLLAVRKRLDDWGRKVLGETVYESTVWGEILLRRARVEIGNAHMCGRPGPHRFLLTVAAEDALLVTGARPKVLVLTNRVPDHLYGVPVDVGPRVEDYWTPGRAWVLRHVSEGYLQAAGDDEIRGMFDRLVDDWCRKAGLHRVGPVELEWSQVTSVAHTLGVVYEVIGRANTARLTDPFLG